MPKIDQTREFEFFPFFSLSLVLSLIQTEPKHLIPINLSLIYVYTCGVGWANLPKIRMPE